MFRLLKLAQNGVFYSKVTSDPANVLAKENLKYVLKDSSNFLPVFYGTVYRRAPVANAGKIEAKD